MREQGAALKFPLIYSEGDALVLSVDGVLYDNRVIGEILQVCKTKIYVGSEA